MAILQHDPMATNGTGFDHLLGLFAHTLTEGKVAELLISVSEFLT